MNASKMERPQSALDREMFEDFNNLDNKKRWWKMHY